MAQLTAESRDHLRATLAAGRAADQLRPLAPRDRSEELVRIVVGGVEVSVPATALVALIDFLEDFSEGKDVTIAPADLVVGTAEAARLLNVSRTWVAELVDRGDLPGERIGTKRRIPLGAVVAQHRAQVARQREAVSALAEESLREEHPAETHGAEPGRLFVRGDVRVKSVPHVREPKPTLARVEPSEYDPTTMAA